MVLNKSFGNNAVVAALVAVSCSYPRPANVGDDDDAAVGDATGDTGGSATDDAAPDGPPPPPVPTYGAQIDRVGRPLINVGLNHTFDTNATATAAARNGYNSDATPASWSGYTAELAKNLAVFDALDGGSSCGNQLLYNGTAAGGGTPAANSYLTLAGILADDRLWVDTSKTTCSRYLSVEVGVAIGLAHTTCGGRAPGYDVVDVTYSMVIYGLSGFSTDGTFLPLFLDYTPPHTNTLATFPFLGQ